jgi:4-amino-4-deoxy-L-arabinose transferase-like glycosyltransferase
MSDRRFWSVLAAVLLLAALLRGLFPLADPPWRSGVGVVWHDEGAWTHNARNKALYGAWVQDRWNPVYIAPVFTGLEYASFAAFGVGLWQARLVSEALGLVSVLLLALGVRRVAGSLAGVFAGALLASNFVYVMYDRAATMEAPMTALIVCSWYCVARSERQPAFGALGGLLAALAFFTKAAAAAYVGALGLLVLFELVPATAAAGGSYRRAAWTIAGLALAFGLIGALFVLPHWTDYRFYNWQMSVTRKPSYDLRSLVTRLSWFPILHGTFSRMWPALAASVCGAWSAARRWRGAGAGERLLVLWLVVGTLELLVHDDGNERYYVYLVPALVALAGIVLSRGVLIGEDPNPNPVPRSRLLLLSPVILFCGYVLAGPLVRLAYLSDVDAGRLKTAVRLSAAAALVATAALIAAWPRAARLLAMRWTPAAAAALAAAGTLWNVAQFADWGLHRTYKNYEASLAVGRALPPGTLVQGKLANGLALDSLIRPVFIGHGFGNYEDRNERDDVRYILTYTSPWLGYEGSQIKDVLDASPGWRIIMSFDVAESPSGHDTAALIEKRARN